MASKAKELEATIRIAGRMDASVQQSIKKATTAIKGLGNKFAKIEKAAMLAGAAITTAFAGAAVAIGKKSVEAASEFEAQMSNVATLLDGDVTKRVAELGDEVLKVSKKTGASTDDLTEGLYQVISAFGDSAESIKIMDIAARAGVAGNASTIESINLLSAVTKGYGDTSAEANSKAADLAFMTVKLGQTSFPELAASLGRVIPLAATMGVKQEELFGAMATLTGVTGKAAEVTTQLRGVVQGFLQPTDGMAQVIAKLGYSSGKAMLEELGLEKSLVALKKAVGGNEIAFSELFGSIEAKGAVLALAGNQLDAFRDKTKAMYKESTGAAARAFATQTDNLKGLIKKLKAYWNSTFIEIGNAILPLLKEVIEKALPKMQEAMDKFRDSVIRGVEALKEWAATINWDEVSKDAVKSLVDFKDVIVDIFTFIRDNKDTLILVGKILATLWIISKVVTFIASVVAAIKVVISVVTAIVAGLTSTIGLVVAAVVAVGVAIWAVYEYWDEICAWCSKIWTFFVNGLKEDWEGTKAFFSGAWESIKGAWNSVCSMFTNAWTFFVNGLKEDWEGTKAFFIGAWQSVASAFAAAWDGVNTKVQNIISSIKAAMQPLVDTVNSIGNGLASAKDAIANSKANPANWFAAGGFTSGPSICGEAGTEAVISFDPAYRKENQGYLMTAAEMLGMTAAPASGSITYNMGGVTFSPVVKVGENANAGDIMRKLRACVPELMDLIEEAMNERNSHRYA